MIGLVDHDVAGLHITMKNRSDFESELIEVGSLVRGTQSRGDFAEDWQSQPVPVDGGLLATTPHVEGDAVNQIHREVRALHSREVEHSVIVDADNVRMAYCCDCPKAPREERKEMGISSSKRIKELERKGVWRLTGAYTIDDATSAGTQLGLGHVRADTSSDPWEERGGSSGVAMAIRLEPDRPTDLGCHGLDAGCGADADLVSHQWEVTQYRLEVKIVEHGQNALSVLELKGQERPELSLRPFLGEEVWT